MARLWEYDDFGEPWLENTPLLIINRKRKKGSKKGKKSMARRRRRTTRRRTRRHRVAAPRRIHRRGRRRTARRRRRNPWPMAGTVASINPRRRRRRGRKHASRRRRRGGLRNPRILGLQLPSIEAVAYGALGYVATPMVEGFLVGFLPATITTSTIGKYATRIASVLGLTWIAKMVRLGGRANMIGIGGGMYVLTTAIKEFASGMLPAGAARALPSMSAYAVPTLAAYAQGTEATYHGGFTQLGRLGASNFGAQNTVRSAPFGGGRLVAQRFRRFN